MNNLFVNNIGDLSEAQRASFYRFLINGINEELTNFPNPFLAKIKIKGKKKISRFVSLYPNEIKLKGPNFSLNTCLRLDITYAIQLFIKGEYSYLVDHKNEYISQEVFSEIVEKSLKRNKIKKVQVIQDIFFGEIPLMTEEGTFVISGCERIVISQIIRSPGIYFRKEYGTNRKAIYTATIISNKGLWTKFILDRKKIKKLKKKEESKIPLFIENNEKNKEFSPGQGKSIENRIKRNRNRDRIYIKLMDYKSKTQEVKKKEKDSDKNKLFINDLIRYFGLRKEEIYDSVKHPQRVRDLDYLSTEDEKEFSDFFDFPQSSISETLKGIKTITEKNGIFIKQLFFNQRSGCFSIGEIGRYNINKKLGLNLPSNITYLTSHDFIGIIDGLMELKYYDRASEDIDHIKNKQIRSIGELLQNQLRIGLYRLQKSLIEEIPFSISQNLNYDFDTYSEPEDWIIDPRPVTNSIKEFFKTSQLSQYMDQINPLAELTHKRRISVFGPNGLKRDHISTVIRDIHPSQYGRLCPIETSEGQNAGLIMSMALYGRINSLGSIETPYFFLENGTFNSKKRTIFLNPEQESETKIAFGDVSLTKERKINNQYLSIKENYLFSVKKPQEINFLTISPLQVVSLATSLIPFLEHDDANRALMGSNMQRQAVPLLYPQKAIVGTGLESIAILDSGMIIKSYCQGKVVFSSSLSIIVTDSSNQNITYYLRKYYRSNQETSLNQRPLVWSGEEIFSGQLIAEGPSTNDGELSLGRNLTIAYMPWEGYNYEDAIVINERILLDDCLTSVHIEEQETTFTSSLLGPEKLTNNLPHLTKYIRRHLNSDGIVRIGSYVKEHDILVGKLTSCEADLSPEARLLNALYGKEELNFRDTSLKVPHGTEGRVIDVRISSTTFLNKEEPALSTSCQVIRIYIAQIRKVKIGDKLSGRHGNKGIVSRILARQDMPYLPDGTPIDVIFNPLGVPSRMNVGQIFEGLLGFAGEKLGKRYKIFPFDEVYGKEASRILVNQKLKEASILLNSTWIFNPSYPGKILLKDGRTGEFFDNPITVGKSYILKLIHLVEDKIHARATGPYSMITEQPLAGKSQKGGQRFGEMEVWAIEAYGCSNTLQELLTIKSDDIDGRNDMYEAILGREEIEKPNPSIPESFSALIRELNALGLDFSLYKFENSFHSPITINQKEKDLFFELENRLKLRAMLARKKSELFPKISSFLDENSPQNTEKKKKKRK
uniref:DNA-directed RNA polymerase subunit beta n=1 Tax=Mallomonas splendens TaxID=52552 RepID=A0A3G2QZV3_9STRA|nr:RNA polymerase beta subunit [Mallomonas splendens]AYO28505.1 RNA polymerase beta subunit [Mallomonas splendens]